jgi:hypothetical protein
MPTERTRQQSDAARAASGSSPPTLTETALRRRKETQAQPVGARWRGSIPTICQVAVAYGFPPEDVAVAFSSMTWVLGREADRKTVMRHVEEGFAQAARTRARLEKLRERARADYRAMLKAKALRRVS